MTTGRINRALKTIAVLSACLYAGAALAQTEAELNHFYLHGWTGDKSDMNTLATYIANQSNDWTSAPDLQNYGSFNSIYSQAASVDEAYKQNHPNGHYIGVGYSAGGLVERGVVNLHGKVDALHPAFVEGFVTLNTPNLGADIAHRWEGWISKQIFAQCKIGRGDLGLAVYGNYLVGIFWTPILVALGELIRASWQFTRDLIPGSSYFTYFNGAVGQGIETSIPRGKTCVYGQAEGRKLPAYNATGDDYHINVAQNAYQQKIDDARRYSHEHDQKANGLNRGGWFRRAANWFARTYHRSRAGDWNASADGWEDLNDAWEWATADRGQSDGFISYKSQTGLPYTKGKHRILGKSNHKAAPYLGLTEVWSGMRDDLLVRQK